MMKIFWILICLVVTVIQAETLFEIKDSANNPVLNISTDGLRVMNLGDTLMVISATDIRANISSSKGLSRAFSVTTASSKGKGLIRVLDVGIDETKIGTPSTVMGLGSGDNYTEFTPLNTFIGLNAGAATNPDLYPLENYGKRNIFIGFQSGRNNIIGYQNVLIGDSTGYHTAATTTTTQNAVRNVCIGTSSGFWNKEGDVNTFVGYLSGYSNNKNGGNSVGICNTYIGGTAGRNNIDGTYNSFMGYRAGFTMTTGSYNTFLGQRAGESKTGGDRNTFLGSNAGSGNSAGSDNVFLGYQAGSLSGAVSNKLYIANTSTNTPLIYGDFSTNNVGLGTNAPGSNRLKVINNASGIAGATGYFENSNSTGIGLAAFATSTDAAFYAEQKNSTSTTANIAKFASQYGGWSEKVIFRSTGSVLMPYLGSSSGTSLQVTSGGEIVKLSSSRRYKKDIAPLSVDMKKFLSLQPVSFKWNEKSASENKADNGLIAEEVEKIDPALAVYNDKGEIEGVDYQKINIMLLKVVQDQEKKIEELEKRLEAVEKRK
jgi:hypothetical protein